MLWPLCIAISAKYLQCIFVVDFLLFFIVIICEDKNMTFLGQHTYKYSCTAVAAPVLRPSDLGGTITIVPVPKAATILDLKHSSDGAHAIRPAGCSRL